MPLLDIQEVMTISESERELLSDTDYTISQTLARHASDASTRGLDKQLVAKATVTMLLVAAARQALLVVPEKDSAALDEVLPLRASEALQWMRLRAQKGPSSSIH